MGEFILGVAFGIVVIYVVPEVVDYIRKERKQHRAVKRSGVTFIWRWLCRNCKHPESRHNGMSGPNSIGKWSHGECRVGAKSYGPYSLGGCNCTEFKKSILPRRYYVGS